MNSASQNIARRSVLAAFGAGVATSAYAQGNTQTMDPRSILFSTPTISNDVPPLEETDLPAADDLVLHEDDWRAVEFFQRSRTQDLQDKLRELKAFEAANREGPGWRHVYVRSFPSSPVIAGNAAVDGLGRALSATPGGAPILYQSPNILVGRVSRGFSLPLGADVWLYGFTDGSGIPVLGASLRPGSDHDRLNNAFRTLHQSNDLVLVDWHMQMILMSVTPDNQLLIWQPS